MAIQPMALGLQNVQGNALGAFAQGQQHAQQTRANDLEMAQRTLQNVGSLAFGVMGGKLDGQPDPARWEEALDLIGNQGVDVSAFRNRPDLAPVVAKASVDVLGQLNNNLNERELAQRMDEFDFKVQEALKAPTSTYSQTPVFFEDADGNQHIGQMSSTGGLLVNGQALPGIPEGWKAVNRPQAFSTINDGGQISAFDPNQGTIAPLATVQGAPSANMNVTVDPTEGRVMAPAPGSDQAVERDEKEKAKQAADAQRQIYADIVTEDIDRVLSAIEENPAWTTGVGAALTQNVPGTPAFNAKSVADTIRANVGFDRLQQMRDASPTGGALGQVSEFENQLLQATLGNLELSQDAAQIKRNLERVKEVYSKIINTGISPGDPLAKDILGGGEAAPRSDTSIDDLLEKYQ